MAMPLNCKFQINRVIDGRPEFARELQGRAAISAGAVLQVLQRDIRLYWLDPLAAFVSCRHPFLRASLEPMLKDQRASVFLPLTVALTITVIWGP